MSCPFDSLAHRSVRGVCLLATLLAAGCAPALLEYGLDTPAAALAPIGVPPVSDGRSRFRVIFCAVYSEAAGDAESAGACNRHLNRLADEPPSAASPEPLPEHDPRLHIILVPGAFSECFGAAAEPFREGVMRLEQLGYSVQTVKTSGRSGSDHNGALIAAAVESIAPAGGVVLIGYSKGTNDILSFLANRPDLLDRIAAVVSVAGSVNGSPLADHYAAFYATWLAQVDHPTCSPGDGMVVESLRRTTAMSRLASQRLPERIRYFSLGSFAQTEHIARAMRLTVRTPLSRVDPRNDGQTIYYDQLLPGSTLLGYANADHWDLVISLRDRMPFLAGNSASEDEFPRAALLEALVLFVAEQLRTSTPGTPAGKYK